MATYAGVVLARHATLTANTVDTVTFASDVDGIEIKNRGTDAIYATYNGVDPTVAGDDTLYIGAGESLIIPASTLGDTVKLISASATAYSVTRTS
jgi:hypothetical protein